MSDLNYKQLTEAELRDYVKRHPEDEEAFQHYLTIIRAKPNRVVVSTGEQLEAELRKRLNIET
jgi:SOS response regulatory protein OraA/RecX